MICLSALGQDPKMTTAQQVRLVLDAGGYAKHGDTCMLYCQTEVQHGPPSM